MKLSTRPNLREAIFDVIAPYDCLLCSAEGTLVCSWCWPELLAESVQKIEVTGLSSCRVVTPYQGGARALVRRMKIDAQRQACFLIARAMHESAPQLPLAVCITSVPTAMARIRERGFDHSALIAKEFARLRGLAYRPLLTRHGRTKQAGATKVQRARQIQGVYLPRPRALIKDRHILVIDDVTTTGATLIEVANVLRAAGAKNLDALVFAQAIQ